MQDISISEEQVKGEFSRSTERFHVITTWVGMILNMVWFISDIFVLPAHWYDFFFFRLGVSVVSLIALLLRKRIGMDIYQCMFLLVLGISVQNAYMWSVMDLAHMQKHSFAYMVLFIGVGMLVLWEIRYSVIMVIATIIANVIFFMLNSELSVDDFVINGGLLIFTVCIFTIFLIRTRYRLTINEIRSRMELAKSKEIIEQENQIITNQKHEIEEQKNSLFEKNKEITDSINYAKRIQGAMLASHQLFKKYFGEYFVLFEPRDIVSGDFYWASPLSDGKFLLVTADSTGHGVPGAMMSMLNISCLNEAVNERKLNSPALILDYARQRIISSLAEDGSEEGGKDGMDCSAIILDFSNLKMTVAAANNPVWIVRALDSATELIEIKPDKMPVGKHAKDEVPFTEQVIDLKKGDVVYTLTDGYCDQFGGERSKKFTYKRLKEMLTLLSVNKPEDQKQTLLKNFSDWKGSIEQVDDVLIIGIKV